MYTEGNFRAYANWAWANQRATNIISNQYLFGPDELAYIRNNWIYTDHSQVWTGSAASPISGTGCGSAADVIYGSGLRSGDFNTDHNPPMRKSMPGMSREFDHSGLEPGHITFRHNQSLRHQLRHQGWQRHRRVRAPIWSSARLLFRVGAKFGPGANKSVASAPSICRATRCRSCRRLSEIEDFEGPNCTGMDLERPLYRRNVGYSASRFTTETVLQRLFALGRRCSSDRDQTLRCARRRPDRLQLAVGMWVAGFETDMQVAHQRTMTATQCPGSICNPAISALMRR